MSTIEMPAIFKKFKKEILNKYKRMGLITPDKAKGIELRLFNFFKPAAITLWKNIIFDPYYYRNTVESYLTLVHETMHAYDQSRIGTNQFFISYLWPQGLALLSPIGLTGFHNKKLFFLLFLFLFYYFPARRRVEYELRAYGLEAAMLYKIYPKAKADKMAKEKIDSALDFLKRNVLQGGYNSQISKTDMRKMYDKIKHDITQESIYNEIEGFTERYKKTLNNMPEE